MRRVLDINDHEFKLIKDLVYRNSGIYLEHTKKALVVGRLSNLVQDLGFESFETYYWYVMKDPSKEALTILIDQISTNHTYFNREAAHFDFLKEKVLPEFIKNHPSNRFNHFRIWCAAASTGEEPYMLGIILSEFFGRLDKQWKWSIVATDISSRALKKAINGIYQSEELQRLNPVLIRKYFTPLDGNQYKVSSTLKAAISFSKFNLIDPIIPFHNSFEVIFLRNVMIYFNLPTKLALVERVSGVLKKKGYLFIGLAESLPQSKINLEYIKPAIYRNSLNDKK